MKIIKLGSEGNDVKNWQLFLRGRKNNSLVIINGTFDQITHDETKEFQLKSKLKDDGVVGPMTTAAALKAGYKIMIDEGTDQFSSNWPSPPLTKLLSYKEKIKLFGSFSYIPAPTNNNPEAIKITDNWAQDNIITIELSQLKNIKGAPANCKIQINRKIENQIIDLFKTWESENLLSQVKTWGGSWSPRFIRGSRTVLSNHAWATAFDINAQWNMLGTTPALKGKEGSVRDLVQIAYDYGFYWGGWFPNRPDGMHFEAYKII